MFQQLISFFQKRPKKTSHTTQNMTKAYFSPGEDCANAIVRALQNAKHSADICVFTISDDKISREIIACHRRKIKIRILTDNEKWHDLGSDIEQMAKVGIATRIDETPGHMHHKFMIVDTAILINGSYNWTKSAAVSNHENVIVSTEKELVAAFSAQFEKMWKEMEQFTGNS